MKRSRAKHLQFPNEVDPSYLKDVIDRKFAELGYKDTRRHYSLSMDLEFVYSQAIGSVRLVNLLIEERDLDRAASAVADLRAKLDDLAHHIRSADKPLESLLEHIVRLERLHRAHQKGPA
jgi:hypothetical protein